MTARFVSRAGEKLQAGLDAWQIQPAGWVCADFGCNVGGFSDCLLQAGASKVYAVDTGYGELAWRLRKDPRVVVMERTNVLYVEPPDLVDLVVIDVAWTPQAMSVPAALRWLKQAAMPLAGAADTSAIDSGQKLVPQPPLIISLLKPHYELAKELGHAPRKPLSDEESQRVCLKVCQDLQKVAPCRVEAAIPTGLRGKGGNLEYLLLLIPTGAKA